MNDSKVTQIAQEKTPEIKTKYLEGWLRHDISNVLIGNDNIGIELGVAKGVYAKRMVNTNKFQRFFGVDVYGDAHDTKEYKEALRYIGIEHKEYSLLRMDFDSALDLFPDNYFDFIYVDGYAHTGEEGGKTLISWWKKLKTGGILAGDDYHHDWPLVKWAVNDFVQQINGELNVTMGQEDSEYCKYPSWFIKKETDIEAQLNKELFDISMSEKERIHNIRSLPSNSAKKQEQETNMTKTHFLYMTNIFHDKTIVYEEPIFMERCLVYNDVKIGAYSYFAHTYIGTMKSMGRFCSITPGVKIGLGEHPIDYVSSHPIFYNAPHIFNFTGDINNLKMIGTPRKPEVIKAEPIIGNDVWIGANAIIARGVTIGDGAIIGANSLVNEDVPPYAIVVGTPAKILKYRFNKKIIQRLLELQWWDYPIEVFQNKPVDNIEAVVDYLTDALKDATPKKYGQWFLKNGVLTEIK